MPHAPIPTARPTVPAPHTPPAASVCICADAGTPTVLYTNEEAARILKVSVTTLRRWRSQEPAQGPAFIRIGGRISYRHQDLADYLSNNRVVPGVAA
ncbi:helix-turn-helix domain-containing protein [Kitasatospora indigofera]|uniref:helix-turn-helix domain-containing protein n=1 Tax=Kitasatospora indigofera TaxID=67307 RepID=UPI003632A9C7